MNLNGASAQLGYTVPFTLVHAGKFRKIKITGKKKKKKMDG